MDASEPPRTLLEADDDDDDDDDNDNDSAIGTDVSSETQTLNSQVTRFEFENGRRYHSFQAGRYAFPNDEEELERMDLENQIFFMLQYITGFFFLFCKNRGDKQGSNKKT